MNATNIAATEIIPAVLHVQDAARCCQHCRNRMDWPGVGNVCTVLADIMRRDDCPAVSAVILNSYQLSAFACDGYMGGAA
jgi:hypothetical protein